MKQGRFWVKDRRKDEMKGQEMKARRGDAETQRQRQRGMWRGMWEKERARKSTGFKEMGELGS